MFRGEQIKGLVEFLEKRDVKLFHSAQYKDFKSYLRLGGIPSRSLLSEQTLEVTSFDTDDDDKVNNVWDKVFLNPIDFGKIFQKDRRGTPTVYGPITFEFEPKVLLDAEDVGICLRSAGGKGFNRESESLKTIDEVDRIFCYQFIDNGFENYLNPLIKNPAKLREEFNLNSASNPEISLSIYGHLLRFKNKVIKIIVDPYKICSFKLINFVNQEIKKYYKGFSIKERFWNKYYKIMPEIVEVLSAGLPTIDELMKNEEISDSFHEWIYGVRENNLEYQWVRYVRYFREGTLLPVLEEINEEIPL